VEERKAKMIHNDEESTSGGDMVVEEILDNGKDRHLSALGKIPQRIKSGRFTSEYLQIVTASGEIDIPLSSIQYICLGLIEEPILSDDGPKSNMRNAIRKLFFGEKPQDDNHKQALRKLYIVDIYVEGQEAAYRMDSSSINYKTFLGEVSYISQHNFKRLFGMIVDHGKNSRFNRSAVAFHIKKQDRVHTFNSICDFEMDCQHNRARLEREISWNDIHEGKALNILRDHGIGDITAFRPEIIAENDGILDDET
jgi:hypothetical protein